MKKKMFINAGGTLDVVKVHNKTTLPVELAYIVTCSSIGNPKYGESPNLPVSIPQSIPCETLRQCSDACKAYIEENGLGGSHWTGGDVYHPTKGLIARVSYNGKLWKPSKKIKAQNLDGKQVWIDGPSEQIITGLDDKL